MLDPLISLAAGAAVMGGGFIVLLRSYGPNGTIADHDRRTIHVGITAVTAELDAARARGEITTAKRVHTAPPPNSRKLPRLLPPGGRLDRAHRNLHELAHQATRTGDSPQALPPDQPAAITKGR